MAVETVMTVYKTKSEVGRKRRKGGKIRREKVNERKAEMEEKQVE